MATEKSVFSIYSPFFPGFYGTVFDASDKAYYDIEDDIDYYRNEYGIELNADEDIDFKYKEYESDIAQVWCDSLRAYLPDCVESVEYNGISSPREYNFRNDELDITVVMTDDWKLKMTEFMKQNYDWLAARIKKDWTSYDGFMSFMDNDIECWWDRLFAEEDGRYVECMIGYMMYRANENIRDALINDVFWNGDSDIYTFLTDSGKEKVAAAEEAKRIKALNEKYQLKIPFVD
jgi:hypothetical protein